MTDDMIERAHRTALDIGWTCAAHEPLDYGDCLGCNEGLDRLATQMLSAALAVAPTADGWVWCERFGAPSDCLESAYRCDGPHLTLIIGPTVETT